MEALDLHIRVIRDRYTANTQMAQYFAELALENQVELDQLMLERSAYLGQLGLSNVIPFPTEPEDVTA